jgi:DNA-binding NtrC family response regulator
MSAMRKVLIVEGAAAERAAYQDALSDRYTVLAADAAGEAIRIMAGERVDAILLNMEMRREEGFTVLGHLIGMYTKPVVVVMTAGNQVTTAVKAMMLGAAECLIRPCAPKGVKEALGRILGDEAAPLNEG